MNKIKTIFAWYNSAARDGLSAAILAGAGVLPGARDTGL